MNLGLQVSSALRSTLQSVSSRSNNVMHVCVKLAAHSYTHYWAAVTSSTCLMCLGVLFGGKKSQEAVCVVWEISPVTMYHTKTAVVTWTHFYCNSSIESKKVLININTMPMFRSPPRTVQTPFSLHKKKKTEGKTWKKSNSSLLIYRRIFLFPQRLSLVFFSFFCVQDICRWEIMHIRRIHTSTVGFSVFQTLSCKANQ